MFSAIRFASRQRCLALGLMMWLPQMVLAQTQTQTQTEIQSQRLPQGQSQSRGDVHTLPVPGDYRVDKERVDSGTYSGWRIFHTACYGCHGVDALGTDLAPNLVERIKALTPRDFATKVLTSYRLIQPETGAPNPDRDVALQALIERVLRQDRSYGGQMQMPAWDDNPRVRPHVLDLYAYLTARADGKLPPGKPRRMDDPATR